MSHILIVEDEPRIASFIEKGLRQKGYTTTLARNAEEARPLPCGQSFSLILLDVGLPGCSGLELLHDWRTAGLEQPVMILTASYDTTDYETGHRYGASAYLTKPFRFQDLLRRIHALI